MRNHATCRGRRTDYFLRSPHFKILLTLHILIKVLNQLKQIVYMTHHNSINFYKVNFFMSSQCKLSCPPIHPSIHPSIFLSVIRGRVVGAAAWAGTPRLPSPWTLPPALPGGSQRVPRPAERHSHSSLGSPPCGTCQENFLREASWGHPKQMPEPPQLAPLDVEKQRLYSELLPGDRGPHPFGHGPKFMAIGEGRNVDWRVNWEF